MDERQMARSSGRTKARLAAVLSMFTVMMSSLGQPLNIWYLVALMTMVLISNCLLQGIPLARQAVGILMALVLLANLALLAFLLWMVISGAYKPDLSSDVWIHQAMGTVLASVSTWLQLFDRDVIGLFEAGRPEKR